MVRTSQRNRKLLGLPSLQRYFVERFSVLQEYCASRHDSYSNSSRQHVSKWALRRTTTNVLKLAHSLLRTIVGRHRFEISLFVNGVAPRIDAYFETGGVTEARSTARRNVDPQYYVKNSYEVVGLLQDNSAELKQTIEFIPSVRDNPDYAFVDATQRQNIGSTVLCRVPADPGLSYGVGSEARALVFVSDHPNAFRRDDRNLESLLEAIGWAVLAEYKLEVMGAFGGGSVTEQPTPKLPEHPDATSTPSPSLYRDSSNGEERKPMKKLVFISNAWGAKHGGINTFNMDLCEAVALAVKVTHDVICVVAGDTSALEVEDAQARGVTLCVIPRTTNQAGLDASHAESIVQRLHASQGVESVDWWIGHDVLTGEAAITCKSKMKSGHVAIIHHMSYIDYHAHRSPEKTISYDMAQLKVLKAADQVFAVGPKLLESAINKLAGHGSVSELIPGLAQVESHYARGRNQAFGCMTLGRLEPRNNVIKQPRLAIAGLAKASLDRRVFHEVRAIVLGLEDVEAQTGELAKLAQQYSGRALNIVGGAYTDNRRDLFDLLLRSDACLMLSIHEGFGLVGWEAIAAAVPLVLTKNSGLYAFLFREFGRGVDSMVFPVDIQGRNDSTLTTAEFTEQDVDHVAAALTTICDSPDTVQSEALKLKAKCAKFTWQRCAEEFLGKLQIS